MNAKSIRKLDLLELANSEKRESVVFVTLLQAHAGADKAALEASVMSVEAGLVVSLRSASGERRFLLNLKRQDPAAPLVAEPAAR